MNRFKEARPAGFLPVLKCSTVSCRAGRVSEGRLLPRSGVGLCKVGSGAARFPRRSRGASAEDENRKGGRARPAFPGLVSREDFGGVGAIELVSTSLRCGMLQHALQA